MQILSEYWHQILLAITVLIMAVRLESEVKNLRKDLDRLTTELERRDTYVETVKQRSEIDINSKQISALWVMINKLRDKFNGDK
jgi:hypothetical protein